MLSESLLKKFDQLIARYPLKRSAMVPLLLYAQDEVGHVSEEVIAEVARRVDVRPIEVVEVIGYYSMLHRQPVGKYNFQVCTNISCMLRGADELFEHCCKKLGIKTQADDAGRPVFAGRSRVPGSLLRRAAMQVNYDFYENLTPEKFDALIEELKKKEPRSKM